MWNLFSSISWLSQKIQIYSYVEKVFLATLTYNEKPVSPKKNVLGKLDKLDKGCYSFCCVKLISEIDDHKIPVE